MVGKVTGQGDRVLRAQVARRNFHLDGRGIKIGVISDSFNALKDAEADIASGDLPGRDNPLGYTKPVRVIKDLRASSDEGRAMMQIITDIAPGAELLFHTAYATPTRITERSFANAVQALARAGADIIVDDVGFPTSLFQDGLAARTVDQVTSRGVAYFSAIGNDSNRSYEGTFRSSSPFTFQGVTYEAHNFAADQAIDLFQDIALMGGDVIAPLLGWDQPAGKVTSDLELFLVSSLQLPEAGGKILATSVTLFSDGVEQPLEQLIYEATTSRTAYLIIARKADATNPTNQIKWISTANSADSDVIYEYVNDFDNGFRNSSDKEPSTVYGQPNAKGAIAVGSVRVNKTPLFGRTPVLDDFSSRGGTPILLDSQGQRFPSPDIRQKPEIVAPNGVATTFQPFNPFFGTSAAAPHAAAVAALILQRAGGPKRLTPAQVLETLQRTAIPIDPAGNFRSGAGLIQADAAVLSAFTRSVEGTNSRDILQGRKGADNLRGLSGNDVLNGGKGFDALFGGADRDRLQGNAGNDYLLGEAGHDVLVGGAGGDALLGGLGQDRLTGSKGGDLLAGGAGRNRLTGGKGQNLFVLSPQGVAIITDFQAGRDRLALTDNLRFNQLELKPQGKNTLIQFRGQLLSRLLGVTTALFAEDFTSIALRD